MPDAWRSAARVIVASGAIASLGRRVERLRAGFALAAEGAAGSRERVAEGAVGRRERVAEGAVGRRGRVAEGAAGSRSRLLVIRHLTADGSIGA